MSQSGLLPTGEIVKLLGFERVGPIAEFRVNSFWSGAVVPAEVDSYTRKAAS